MNIELNKIGTLIRDERVRRGMTQEELGSKICVGKAQISKIESGKGLTIKTVTKVLDALNLSATIHLEDSQNINKHIINYIITK